MTMEIAGGSPLMPGAGGVDLEVGGGVGAAHHVPGHAGVHALVLRGHGLDVVNIRQARAARRLEEGQVRL